MQLFKKKYNLTPLDFDYHKFIVSNQKGEFISIRRVNGLVPKFKLLVFHLHICILNNLLTMLDTIWAATWYFQHVLCATSKASDQPAHMCSLIRAFASGWNILWVLGYLTEQHGISKLKRRLHRLVCHIVVNHIPRLILSGKLDFMSRICLCTNLCVKPCNHSNLLYIFSGSFCEKDNSIRCDETVTTA